jgi:hypothetical protein
MQDVFKQFGVKHIVTENETKANIAERSIKTVKKQIYKYMSQYQTFKYIDVLDDITNSYNNSYHRSIKITPASVNQNNKYDVLRTLYPFDGKSATRKEDFTFDVGDWVRISYLRKVFDREYHETWSYEIYKITERKHIQNRAVYHLRDYANEDIKGNFYPEELQRVKHDDDAVWRISKVIRTKKTKRKGQPTEHLVQWLGWRPKFNSWVSDRELQGIKHTFQKD